MSMISRLILCLIFYWPEKIQGNQESVDVYYRDLTGRLRPWLSFQGSGFSTSQCRKLTPWDRAFLQKLIL